MQARAIFEAACDVAAEGIDVRPEIMIPLVATRKEIDHQAKVVREVAAAVFAERGRKVRWSVGTMIEVPRAALRADAIAGSAEFFSFGTNDLTQTTYGISRDDVGPVLASYLERGIYDRDPFVTVDRLGVGELMRIAVERGRAVRPGLKVGICGEHGGDPNSVEFCHQLGLDYVSCSPYRLPIARLAAAQAALKEDAAGAQAAPAAKPGAAPRAAARNGHARASAKSPKSAAHRPAPRTRPTRKGRAPRPPV
jgi:pyruvate,orthophosphate dikinase